MFKERFWAAFNGYDAFFMYHIEDVHGNVVYIGPYIHYTGSGTFKAYNIRLIILTCISFALSIITGIMDIAGLNTIWQVAPLAVEVFFGFWAVLASFRTLFYNPPFKYHEFTVTVGSLHKRISWVAMGAAAGFITMISYVLPNGFEGKALATILYIAGKAANAALAYLIYNQTDKERYFKDVKQEKTFEELFGTPEKREYDMEEGEGEDFSTEVAEGQGDDHFCMWRGQ